MDDVKTLTGPPVIPMIDMGQISRAIADLRTQLAAANERAETAERERDAVLAKFYPSRWNRDGYWGCHCELIGDTPLDALRSAMAAEQLKGSEHD